MKTGLVTGLAIVLALSQMVFAWQLDRPSLFLAGPLVIVAALGAIHIFWAAHRMALATTVLPLILLVYGFESWIAHVRPLDATMASRRGAVFDTRSLWEAIEDERAHGQHTYPSFQPRELMVLDLTRPPSRSELQNRVLSPEWGIAIDGERVLPLAGMSSAHIINCNEGGSYAEYDSDEHGFNNPRGVWARPTIDIALVGDSFTQGDCVGADETPAGWIRRRYPATLNLGMGGNGPLLELASLEEYLAPKQPKVVFWVYYNNDLADLEVERRFPLLHRYLEEEGFTQHLSGRQARIDEGLVGLSDRIQAVVSRWPRLLASLGLTRPRIPIWLGDLVMGESHSSAAAVMRLDRVTWGLTTRLVSNPLDPIEDLSLFTRVLARANQRVRSWGGRLYFVYVADLFYLHYRGRIEHPSRQSVLAAVKASDIPVIDTHPQFLAVPNESDIRYHMESHLNPEGYKLLASIMLKALADEE